MMRTKFRLLTLTLILAAAALTLTGCGVGFDVGLNPVKWHHPESTSKFTYEYEYIPKSEIMRMDTQPRWAAGRYVFQRGADSILLVSRITSWSDIATKEMRQGKEPMQGMKERQLERLWICIPQGVPVGAEIDLGQLETLSRVDYDIGDIDDAQFVQPFRLEGKLRILEIKKDSIKARLNTLVRPGDSTEWKIDETIDVPITVNGRRAKLAPSDTVITPVVQEGESTQAIFVPTTQPDSTSLAPATMPGSATQPMADVTHAPEPEPTVAPSEPATQPASTQPEGGQPANKSIVGLWWSRQGIWEERMQINKEGSFVFSSCRIGYDPGIIKGDWYVKENTLVLHVKSFVFVKSDAGVGKSIEYCMSHFRWVDGGGFELDGLLPRPDNIKHWVFHPAAFPDMALITPPVYDGKYLPPDATGGK